jgi:hypothetical protein
MYRKIMHTVHLCLGVRGPGIAELCTSVRKKYQVLRRVVKPNPTSYLFRQRILGTGWLARVGLSRTSVRMW